MTDGLEPIDLLHRELECGMGIYVVDTDDGIAIVDCGPTRRLETLRAGLAARGLTFQDVRHILLTHIHLDHAGAAGAIVRENPVVQVHVAEIGVPHVVDPSRLEASSRRIFGAEFDGLWGEIVPVPEENVRVAGTRVLGLQCFPSPGHARHHVSYLTKDGTLYAGDSAGVRISPGTYVIAPTPPPDIDLEAWEETINESLRRRPARLALPHFGIFHDVEAHFERLRDTLHRWSERVADGMGEEEFTQLGRQELAASDPDRIQLYENAATIASCHGGIARYWQKRREAVAPDGPGPPL